MTFPDLINGSFELGGAFANLLNVIAIRKDRDIRGVHWLPYAFFSLWGVWNLYYYPHLDQWLSFSGGCAIVLVNLTWLGHALYYKLQRQETRSY